MNFLQCLIANLQPIYNLSKIKVITIHISLLVLDNWESFKHFSISRPHLEGTHGVKSLPHHTLQCWGRSGMKRWFFFGRNLVSKKDLVIKQHTITLTEQLICRPLK
jgi:hypothetical protein